MTDESGRLLVPLVCPRCGGDLEAPSPSRVGICLNCKVATFMRQPENEYHLFFIEARERRPSSEIIYAPFWLVKGSGSFNCGDDKKKRIYQNARKLGPLYFPAFWTPKAANYENLTIRYALAQESLVEDKEAHGAILAGVLDPSRLAAMAALCYAAYLDRLADVTGVEASYKVEQVAYAAVPFLKAGKGWTDGVLGVAFPGAYFFGGGPTSALNVTKPETARGL